jgi:hypothetical protein
MVLVGSASGEKASQNNNDKNKNKHKNIDNSNCAVRSEGLGFRVQG